MSDDIRRPLPRGRDDQTARAVRDHGEWAYLELFRQTYPDFPVGISGLASPPAPDVLIRTTRGLVGIEITRIRGAGQNEESFHITGLRKAREHYEAAALPPLDVLVSWGASPPSGRTAEFAIQLGDFVINHLPNAGEHVRLDWTDGPNSDATELFASIRIRRLDGHAKNQWSASWGGYLGTQAEAVDARIRTKSSRLCGYRQGCDEVWLLLVVDGLAPSQWVDVGELLRLEFNSPFDRTFLLDVLHQATHRLHTNVP